jgi:hypothetical protein
MATEERAVKEAARRERCNAARRLAFVKSYEAPA